MPVPQNLGLTPLTQQNLQPYLDNGLTYMSMNPDLIERDGAGNYIISADTDQLLLIDTIDARYRKKSVIRAVNTAFNYFSFPVTANTSSIDIPEIELAGIDIDLLYARYKPSQSEQFIASAENFSGIDMGTVVDGLPQTTANSYTISKAVKNSGANLRFRIKINHSYIATSGQPGGVAFSIAKSGPNFPLEREWIDQFAPTIPGYNWSQIPPGTTTDTSIDIIINNNEFEIGDSFQITANSAQPQSHVINADQTYWSITDASKNVDEWNQPIE